MNRADRAPGRSQTGPNTDGRSADDAVGRGAHRIAVCISTRIDPVSGRGVRSVADAAAVSMALAFDGEPLLVTASDMSDAVARDYLALGVPKLRRLHGEGDVAGLIAAAVKDVPIVLCGARGEGGVGSGLLPYAVAAALGRPLVAGVVELEPDGTVLQALPRGARRRLRVSAPALFVLDARAAPAVRYSYDAAQRGRIEDCRVAALAAPNADPDWQFEPARRQLQALAARTRDSSHARMAGALGTSAGRRAGVIVTQGSTDDKARALLEHLRSLALI